MEQHEYPSRTVHLAEHQKFNQIILDFRKTYKTDSTTTKIDPEMIKFLKDW